MCDSVEFSTVKKHTPEPPRVRETAIHYRATTSHTVTGLINNEAYAFQVRAVNAVGAGAASTEATTFATQTIPDPPPSLWAVPGNGQITLRWITPDDGGAPILRYQVREKVGRGAFGSWNSIPNSGPTTTSYTVTGRNNYVLYTYQVRAQNILGGPDESTEASATPSATAPPEPTWELVLTPATAIRRGSQSVEARIELTSIVHTRDGVEGTLSTDETIYLQWGGAPLTGDVRGRNIVLPAGQRFAGTTLSAPSSGGTPYFDVPDRRKVTALYRGAVVGTQNLAVYDDDPKPRLRLSAADTLIREGDDVELTVHAEPTGFGQSVEVFLLINPTGEDKLVNYSKRSTLTFAPGEASKSVTFQTTQNTSTSQEHPLTFLLRRPNRDHEEESYALSGESGVAVTILDRQRPRRVSIFPAEANEADEKMDFEVWLFSPAWKRMTVDYATRDGRARAGADYETTRGTLTFEKGDRQQTIRVPIIDDTDDDSGETFTVELSNPSGDGLTITPHRTTATGTIYNTEAEQAAAGLTAAYPPSPFASTLHTGAADRPQVIVAFSEPVAAFDTTTPSVAVTGGAVSGVARHTEDGLSHAWIVWLTPAGTAAMTFRLVAEVACDAGGICTDGG